MPPAVSVVIPAHNSAATVGRTLDALSRQDLDGELEVIVVDDGSTDRTAHVVRDVGIQVRLLTQENRGPAAARNLGVAEARAEVIAFTDADCFPAPGWLRAGLEAIRDADLVQGAVRPDPRAPRHPLDRTVWVVEESGLYETANVFVRREAFERLGGFEDWLPVAVGKPLAEDVWLGWRLRRAGGVTRFCEEALVHHAVFPTTVREELTEAARLFYFPFMAARIPELRDSLFYRRVFLSRDTAVFDLAAAGAAVAIAARSPLPALAAAPYAWRVLRGAAGWRRHAPRVAAARLLTDATGLAALLLGGVRARSPVL
jgi:glycosyltransferase involved in cell wall biosynthesis